MSGDRDTRVKLMTLREYRSEAGRTYFRGFLGDSVLLIFRDDEAPAEYGSVATWHAHVVPRKPKAADGAPAARRPSSTPAARSQRRAGVNGRRPAPDLGPDPNDPLPF